MWVIIFSILSMIIIVVIIKVFLSDADEIPNIAELPTFINTQHINTQRRTNTVEQHHSLSIDTPIQQSNTATFVETIESPKSRKMGIAETIAEDMFEQPELITLDQLLQYRLGFNRDGKLHYFVCCFLYSFVLIFRCILFVFECLGYLFFHIVIRFFFEIVIRLIWFLIKLPFKTIGHLLDGI